MTIVIHLDSKTDPKSLDKDLQLIVDEAYKVGILVRSDRHEDGEWLPIRSFNSRRIAND